ncbi:MAG: helix-turn-helix transcriptional regulator [Calditrichaeota bacterium]|nr:helix-turn-helix transcriptional regulator [Calditrichota bacterium]
MNFPNRIREIRENKKYSATDLAKQIGISESELAKIEDGQANPKFSVLNKVAEVLNCEVVDLMERRSEQSKRRTEDSDLVKFEKLEKDYYALIKKFEDLQKKYDTLKAKS